ncbi:hypothetical protein [Chondromyces apiculatus]|uniref:Uncharacterized protein n=1 Tax=Chondromyces apiculatus DSM 436 TaxID=1192034 RepID=A0A017TD79_9BACT|nr:hypothetical protein [Chondromyces apiculatus]EYF07253.1 Hypothetical protein CAP_0732 [Chondromyces apiculatus DSM 436]
MANSMVQPFEGPYELDYQPLQGTLVYVAHGAMRGVRREKAGWPKVELELAAKLPLHAQALHVSPTLYTEISTLTGKLTEVRVLKEQVERLLEVLDDTEVHLEDTRESLVGHVVESARRTAKRSDPGMVVAFEEAIRYHGQVGRLAAKRRLLNEEAAAAAAAAAAAEAEAEAEAENTQ